jgi:hypothetical protein
VQGRLRANLGRLALASPASATTASQTAAKKVAAVTVTVCLKNASTQCADVKDSNNTSGTRIWLYPKSGANDYHWLYVGDPSCNPGACFYLKDAQKSALCLTATGANGARVELENCGEAGSWYNEGGNEQGNAFYGANATLITNASTTEYYLYANRTGAWRQWTIN